jgi:hypothetical protein
MHILHCVSPKRTTALRLDEDLLEAMRSYKKVEGIPVTTQIERATREWLKRRGVTISPKKTDRKRVATRRRP